MLTELSTIYVQVPSPLWGEIETEGREEREREGEGTETEMGWEAERGCGEGTHSGTAVNTSAALSTAAWSGASSSGGSVLRTSRGWWSEVRLRGQMAGLHILSPLTSSKTWGQCLRSL